MPKVYVDEAALIGRRRLGRWIALAAGSGGMAAATASALLRSGVARAEDVPVTLVSNDEPGALEAGAEDDLVLTGVDAPPETGVPEGPLDLEIGPLEIQMLALVNGARLSRGISALEWDMTIAAVARTHATDMMRRGVVSHTGSDGSTPNERMRRAGVKFQFGSENIWTYWGKVPEQGPPTMHAAMMAEPHRPGLWNHIANILYTGYRRIGIGIVVAPSGVQYLSEKFAD